MRRRGGRRETAEGVNQLLRVLADPAGEQTTKEASPSGLRVAITEGSFVGWTNLGTPVADVTVRPVARCCPVVWAPPTIGHASQQVRRTTRELTTDCVTRGVAR